MVFLITEFSAAVFALSPQHVIRPAVVRLRLLPGLPLLLLTMRSPWLGALLPSSSATSEAGEWAL